MSLDVSPAHRHEIEGVGLRLTPIWQQRLTDYQRQKATTPERSIILPKSPRLYAERLTYVTDKAGAEGLLQFCQERPLAWIGFDTEFRYTRPGVVINSKHTAYDPRSLQPLLLALALVEPTSSGKATVYRFVVDLRSPEVCDAVHRVFRLPICFVAHYAHADLLCLYQLAITEPDQLWDTWVHEKALHLGRNHKRYKSQPDDDSQDQARAAEEAENQDEFSFSLVSTCQRYGVMYAQAGDKTRLQQSFLDHSADARFTMEQIEYAAADAVAVTELYGHQMMTAMQAGILDHLLKIEMPWLATNARMVWRGVRIDEDKCRRVITACDRHLKELQPKLDQLGVPNVRSHAQLEQFFRQLDLLHLFQRSGKTSFDKSLLGDFRDRHQAIPLILAARRVHELEKDKVLTGEFVGADGRVHPEYRHLGTHSGRQTSKWPNLLGLGRVFRPLVIPESGRGIGEIDWSQIEVGIAAAVYGDDELVRMFNQGDVYSAMAQHFHGPELSEEDRQLAGKDFKKKHSRLRNQMKTCTLGIIYGLTPFGLAARLKTSKYEATALQGRFMTMFPTLKRGLSETPYYGALRGYVCTSSGLRRYRINDTGSLSSWERNWMVNQPVQGSAAVVFKAAGNRLHRLYQRYDAWLIIPMHDAFVFEAPLSLLNEVTELTARVMCDVVQEHFPVLNPQVEVNDDKPECWNKDGHADAVERWIQEPTYTF